MKNIIEKFYYGEVIPCEKPSPDTKEYKETSALLEKTTGEMLKKYPDLKTQLGEYRELLYKLSSLESAADFANGFRFGALFMCDVFRTDRKEKDHE